MTPQRYLNKRMILGLKKIKIAYKPGTSFNTRNNTKSVNLIEMSKRH